MLLRVYTQNIDTLERRAGLPPETIVEAHGSFATATCLECGRAYTQTWMEAALFPAAGAGNRTLYAAGDAESDNEDNDSVPSCDICGGVVKPDITFFGVALPTRFLSMLPGDVAAADLLIVMGTSLKVFPVASLPAKVSPLCPRVLINREIVGHVLEADASSAARGKATNSSGMRSSAAPAPAATAFAASASYEDISEFDHESEVRRIGGDSTRVDGLDFPRPMDHSHSITDSVDSSLDIMSSTDDEDNDGDGAPDTAAWWFLRPDNYRDVLLQCDADSGARELVRALDAAAAAAGAGAPSSTSAGAGASAGAPNSTSAGTTAAVSHTGSAGGGWESALDLLIASSRECTTAAARRGTGGNSSETVVAPTLVVPSVRRGTGTSALSVDVAAPISPASVHTPSFAAPAQDADTAGNSGDTCGTSSSAAVPGEVIDDAVHVPASSSAHTGSETTHGSRHGAVAAMTSLEQLAEQFMGLRN